MSVEIPKKIKQQKKMFMCEKCVMKVRKLHKWQSVVIMFYNNVKGAFNKLSKLHQGYHILRQTYKCTHKRRYIENM